VSKVITRVRMLSFDIDAAPQSLPLVRCSVDDTLFEVRNLLFMCIKPILLLWKPHSWF